MRKPYWAPLFTISAQIVYKMGGAARRYVEHLLQEHFEARVPPCLSTAHSARVEKRRMAAPGLRRPRAAARRGDLSQRSRRHRRQRLPPGAKLTEEQLGAVFGVSRTIVRSALQALAHDHIVTIERNRGAFVSAPTVAGRAGHFLQPQAGGIRRSRAKSRAGSARDMLAHLRALLDDEAGGAAARRPAERRSVSPAPFMSRSPRSAARAR